MARIGLPAVERADRGGDRPDTSPSSRARCASSAHEIKFDGFRMHARIVSGAAATQLSPAGILVTSLHSSGSIHRGVIAKSSQNPTLRI